MQSSRVALAVVTLIWVGAFDCYGPDISAQSVSTAPTFEVSTVRPGDPDARSSNLDLGDDRIRSSNLPLIFLLQFAFDLNAGSKDQIIGAPSWISSVPFEINAKMDEQTATRVQKMSADERIATLRQMVRTLLADRFQLKVHHERRELPVLALKVTKRGTRLMPAMESSPVSREHWSGLRNPARGRMEGRDVPVSLLVNALSSKPEIGGRLVVNQTELKGKYDFTLTWAPQNEHSATDSMGESSPTLFTALEEQLGLKLESTKAPVDCIVIDRVEPPSPN